MSSWPSCQRPKRSGFNGCMGFYFLLCFVAVLLYFLIAAIRNPKGGSVAPLIMLILIAALAFLFRRF